MLWSREAERHGEGSWHASGATRGLLQLLGWPKPLRFPRLAASAHYLVYLIYSINHHDGFCHLLAIVVDFLKIEKVELTVFEKARLTAQKPPKTEGFLAPDGPFPRGACLRRWGLRLRR